MTTIGIDATSLSKQKSGIGNYVYSLVKALAEEAPQINLVLYGYKDLDFPTLPNVKQRKFSLKLKGPLYPIFVIPLFLLFDRVTHFWGASGYLPLFEIQKIHKIITVYDLVYINAGHTMSFLGYWSRRWFQPLAIHRADQIIAISEFTKKEIQRVYNKKNIIVIHPLIDTIHYSGDALKFKDQTYNHISKPYIFVLGTIEPRKNILNLITAYSEIISESDILKNSKNHSLLPLLVIAGELGWKSKEIQLAINKLSQDGYLIHLGYVKNEYLPFLYQNAEFFMMPSIYEGFGMPIVEAQLNGTPIAASNIEVFHEASDRIGCFFEPTKNGIKTFLQRVRENQISLVCRRKDLIECDPHKSAKTFLKLLVDQYKG